jgi:hypothetical protein
VKSGRGLPPSLPLSALPYRKGRENETTHSAELIIINCPFDEEPFKHLLIPTDTRPAQACPHAFVRVPKVVLRREYTEEGEVII